MTYTVKNGTWCKDNNKEYYSTTKTGLKAALAAGEITSGTKVVIHEPQYHAGQLIQSLNPECPEGCFVPHGQAFDTSIYTELAKLFPDGNLPDMRECVMVCAGENEHITTHEHDVFSAGEFKDDCAAAGNHSHTITINDPGHGHGVSDPGHGHSVSDPGHSHTISDPGHSHTIYMTAAPTDYGVGNVANGEGNEETILQSTTRNPTGIGINNGATGITVGSQATGISVNGSTTGITAECSQAGASGAKVTRTKQFGVYYYIAF